MVDTERGAGDLRHPVSQVFWKDGTLLAEHDWLHDDPIFANCFLRAAAERGEWLPVKLRTKTDSKPSEAKHATPAPAGSDIATAAAGKGA